MDVSIPPPTVEVLDRPLGLAQHIVRGRATAVVPCVGARGNARVGESTSDSHQFSSLSGRTRPCRTPPQVGAFAPGDDGRHVAGARDPRSRPAVPNTGRGA